MLKALSLWQPWSSLMAIGAKRIETRSWSTDYRGLIAIHAAKKWDSGIKDTIGRSEFWNVLYPTWPNRSPEDLPRGCFIAVGKLADCLSTSKNPKLIPNGHEFLYGDYSPGRFMWIFDEVWKLREPVYARGYQGLWTIPTGGLLDEIAGKLEVNDGSAKILKASLSNVALSRDELRQGG